MYRLITAYVCLCSVLIFCLGCGQSDQTKQVQEIKETKASKVGAFIHATGTDDYAAKAFEQGMQLALDKKASPEFTPQFFNVSQGSSTDSAELKTLVESDNVPLIFYWTVDDVAAVSPYLTESKVIGLVSWDVTEKISSLGNHIYGFGYSTEMSFKELAKFAGNTLKSYRFGLISTSQSRYDTQSKAFSEQTKSLGNTVVFDEKVDPTASDFASLIARAQKENCDTIFATLPSASLISFIKAARLASYKGRILVGDSLFAPEIEQLGADAEGIYMMQAWSEDASFKSLYTAKYPSTPDNVLLGAAALGYDAINCIQGTGSFNSRDISHSFLANSCEGITGKTQFSGLRIAQRKKRVVTVKSGKFELAK